MSCRKIGSTSSILRSHGGLKYTMSSRLLVLCNQTQLVVKHHKLECPVEKLDYCVQGQGNSERSIISVNVCPDDIF